MMPWSSGRRPISPSCGRFCAAGNSRPGRWTPAGPGARDEITLYEADGGAYAFAGGRQAVVELIDPFAKAEGAAEEGDAAIRAPMNGRVVALAVGEGEKVEAGQRLAVVEAMKMEHALVAPHPGVVRDLTVDVGDQVDMGERVMRVEGEKPKDDREKEQ